MESIFAPASFGPVWCRSSGPVRGAFEVDLVLWVAQRAQFPGHGLADIYSTDASVLVRPVLGVLVAEVWLMSESE
jgi:hypothetical protein